MEFKGKSDLVKKAQKSLGLKADGEDGPMTWNAILNKLGIVSSNEAETKKGTLAEKLVALARKEVGVEEINGTNCGPRVNEYKSATWLDSTKSWPWCAAFICWLFREAMKDGKYSFKRPQTAGERRTVHRGCHAFVLTHRVTGARRGDHRQPCAGEVQPVSAGVRRRAGRAEANAARRRKQRRVQGAVPAGGGAHRVHQQSNR